MALEWKPCVGNHAIQAVVTNHKRIRLVRIVKRSRFWVGYTYTGTNEKPSIGKEIKFRSIKRETMIDYFEQKLKP